MAVIQIILGIISVIFFYGAGATHEFSVFLVFGIPDAIVYFWASSYAKNMSEAYVNGAMAWPRFFMLLAILNAVAYFIGLLFGRPEGNNTNRQNRNPGNSQARNDPNYGYYEDRPDYFGPDNNSDERINH